MSSRPRCNHAPPKTLRHALKYSALVHTPTNRTSTESSQRINPPPWSSLWPCKPSRLKGPSTLFYVTFRSEVWFCPVVSWLKGTNKKLRNDSSSTLLECFGILHSCLQRHEMWQQTMTIRSNAVHFGRCSETNS
ncbi:hypothetical protein MPTK1_6g06600 [Marchantia polymorpha subsp. ruderalis]|uniref:Uncharacterized protein n=2 Tax=Marchantia polymorpha TaxID=3197 RepID=A0AAF6BP79_MARPO|nr:hypothetical protein MARPO_0173s0005 [Marchantia polymorpha]BBN13813.1 hypothetical protein Mp_6g06600 [Marchantia polymorpha subsp. ruderalis]|eukprot:PTQ28102.1 hypothetical protein MARPO_0173s0005 [Marchantia polymorpha]